MTTEPTQGSEWGTEAIVETLKELTRTHGALVRKANQVKASRDTMLARLLESEMTPAELDEQLDAVKQATRLLWVQIGAAYRRATWANQKGPSTPRQAVVTEAIERRRREREQERQAEEQGAASSEAKHHHSGLHRA